MKEIKMYDALKLLRNKKEGGLPSKLVFYYFDDKTKKSKGIRIINKAFIRPSLSKDQFKSNILVNITDEEAVGNKNRSFYLPLLIGIDEYKVKAE